MVRGNQFYEQIPELVESAQKGDEQALSGLCQFAYKKIYPYVYYRIKQREDAEDVTSIIVTKIILYLLSSTRQNCRSGNLNSRKTFYRGGFSL